MRFVGFRRLAVLAAASLGLAACSSEGWQGPPAARKRAWTPEEVAVAAKIPVQDQGRIKPLDTYASFLLLRLNEKRLAYGPDPAGTGKLVRLTPVEWVLDCLFYPEQARHYRDFRIVDWRILDSIGLSDIARKKADYYSFEELLPAADKLRQLADTYGGKEAKDRTALESEVVALWHGFAEFRALLSCFEFARHRIDIKASKGLRGMFEGHDDVAFGALLAKVPSLMHMLDVLRRAGADEIEGVDPAAEANALEGSLRACGGLGGAAFMLSLIPPSSAAGGDAEWQSVASVSDDAFGGTAPSKTAAKVFDAIERAAAQRNDPAGCLAALRDLHATVRDAAAARGEYRKIEMEVAYYRADLMFKAQWAFVAAFLIVAFTWLLPRSRWLARVAQLSLLGSIGVLIAGIVMRCILRERPPITGLYDTMLWVSALGPTAALVMEWITKKRVGLAVGAALGMGGMFLAGRYELSEGVDTMPRLMAVLRTNFWLATHVTCVVSGYAGGMLAGFMAHVYVLGRLFGFRRGDAGFYRGLARMVYGVLCFGLIFSVVGTILGGIWANYSWGRFWGWDPKENGALMICLWEIAILHGRMGGYLRGLGICIAAVLGNAVIAFSWFHVNMLGVGLHAYGEASGITALYTFYGVELLVAGLGVWLYLRERAAARVPAI